MIIALRATSPLQLFHCRIAWVVANANDVPPKTKTGHESSQSTVLYNQSGTMSQYSIIKQYALLQCDMNSES